MMAAAPHGVRPRPRPDARRRGRAAARVPREAEPVDRDRRDDDEARQAAQDVRAAVEEGLPPRARGAAPARAVGAQRGEGRRASRSTARRSRGSSTPSAAICRGSRSRSSSSGSTPADRPVTSDDVDELVADTRERSVFELTDAIGAADRPRALAAVASLCDQRESAVGVVVMLARHVRQLVAASTSCGATTIPRGEWGSRIGVPPFVVDKLADQARCYSPRALARATQRLANADRALKGDITLDSRTATTFTGPQMKALGRELARARDPRAGGRRHRRPRRSAEPLLRLGASFVDDHRRGCNERLVRIDLRRRDARRGRRRNRLVVLVDLRGRAQIRGQLDRRLGVLAGDAHLLERPAVLHRQLRELLRRAARAARTAPRGGRRRRPS